MSSDEEIRVVKNIILKTVDCEQVYLFGSYAYGTPHEGSDYDFYVVLRDGAENPLESMGQVYWNLARDGTVHKAIDLLGQYKSRFEERKTLRTIEKTVVEKGILLYEAISKYQF